MANASGSSIPEESDFYPYGGERVILDGHSNNYKFTGKERDGESGLDYFGVRYLTSSLGRFMSPDEPLWDQFEDEPQSWNLYGYVRNNPMINIDPSGRECVTIQDADGNEVVGDDGHGRVCGDMTEGDAEPSAEVQEIEESVETVTAETTPPLDSGAVSPGFLGPADIIFIRIPSIPGLIRGILGKTASNTAAAGAEKAAVTTAQAALRAEVTSVVTKAASTVGNQSMRVNSREVAEQAAKEWVGAGAKPIVERSTGAQVGWKSADGMKIARFTSANKANPYINLENKLTGGNLHVRF